MSPALTTPWRLGLLVLAVLGAFAVLGWRLVRLHVVEGPALAAAAAESRLAVRVEPSRRGAVRDARGQLLASTQPVMQLGLDPQEFRPEQAPRLAELAALLSVPEAELRRAAETLKRVGDDGVEREIRWTVLADGLDEAAYDRAMALGLKGVYGNRQFQRTYPGGRLAAHLLGYLNREGTPNGGVEAWLDYYLRGQDGWRETEKDGRRHELAQFRARAVAARAGLDVELTVDLAVQHVVEAELDRIVEEFNPAGATVIVSEPATGALLALANRPTFDPNTFWEAPVADHRNRALSDVFEPGSTFKIVPLAGALERRLVTAATVFDCSVGSAEYNGRMVRLPRDSHAHGELTVAEIAAQSSNRGAALLGMRMGADHLYRLSRAFGFGERTGLGPVGETVGLLHAPKDWDGLTISRLPCGHAVAATPLQVHYAMSVLANDGVLMQPLLARRVATREGVTVAEFAPRPRRRVVSPGTARELTRLLEKVPTKEGTARQAAIEGFSIAGKTGTTQKIVDGRYSNRHHVASFTGFFPSDNPRLVITVVIDEPRLKGTGYGGLVAAPSFKRVAEGLIAYYGLRPNRPAAGPATPLVAQGGTR